MNCGSYREFHLHINFFNMISALGDFINSSLKKQHASRNSGCKIETFSPEKEH